MHVRSLAFVMLALATVGCEQILGYDDARTESSATTHADSSADGRYLIRNEALRLCLSSTSWSDGNHAEYDAWLRPCGTREVDGPANLALDPSFEDASADAWISWGDVRVESNALAPTGANVVALTDRGGVDQRVPVQRSAAYLVSVQVDPGSSRVTVGVKEHGYPEQFEQVEGAGFVYHSMPFVTGPEADSAVVYLMNPGTDPGATVFGDDVVIESLADVPSDHLWDLRALDAGSLEIANAQHDPPRLLTVVAGGVDQNPLLTSYPATPGESQLFELGISGGTTKSLRVAGDDSQCVTATGDHSAVLAPCDASAAEQRWELVCVSGPCALGR